jgi:hypothetical protein
MLDVSGFLSALPVALAIVLKLLKPAFPIVAIVLVLILLKRR